MMSSCESTTMQSGTSPPALVVAQPQAQARSQGQARSQAQASSQLQSPSRSLGCFKKTWRASITALIGLVFCFQLIMTSGVFAQDTQTVPPFPLPGEYRNSKTIESKPDSTSDAKPVDETPQRVAETKPQDENDGASEPDVVTEVDDIYSLMRQPLQTHSTSVRFDLELTVSYVSPARNMVRFQSGQTILGGKFASDIPDQLPKLGALMRVQGHAQAGVWVLVIDQWEDIGEGHLPKPIILDGERISDDEKLIGEYCQVRGELEEMLWADGKLMLLVNHNGIQHRWVWQRKRSESDLSDFFGRRIRLSGVAMRVFDRKGDSSRVGIHGMEWSQITYTEVLRPMSDARRIQGQVVSKDRRNWIGVHNESDVTWVWTQFADSIPLGTEVEVLLETSSQEPERNKGKGRLIEIAGQSDLPEPQFVTASNLIDFDTSAARITTTGEIIYVSKSKSGLNVRLIDQGIVFVAHIAQEGVQDRQLDGDQEQTIDLSQFKLGNTLQVTGVPLAYDASHVGRSAFKLLVSDVADVDVVAGPSGSGKLYSGWLRSSWLALGAATLGVAALAGCVLLFFYLLQSRVKARTRDAVSWVDRLQASCDVICEGIFFFDSDDRLFQVTGAAQSFCRSGSDSLMSASQVGRQAAEHFDAPQEFLAHWQKAFADDDAAVCGDFLVAEKMQTLTICTTPVIDANGQYDGRVITLTDVTEKRKVEQSVAKSQNLAAIGRLAGGVAHDFNNLLMAISANVSLARKYADDSGRVDHHTSIAEDAIDRASRLTQQLLSFSRRSELTTKVCHANDCINQVGTLMRHMLDADVELCLNMATDLWPTKIDAIQIEHVLLNLCINARDSLVDPSGKSFPGTITVQSRNSTDSDLGECVEISVRDDGAGMDEATAASAFEPFFTTKDIGQGTGLGLAMSFGIVQQHGGRIECDSQLGHGSRFSVFLPKTDEPFAEISDTVQVQVARVRASAESKRILLIDDEPMIRDAGTALLSALGHETVCAADGQHAISLLSGDHDFDMVLLDLTMPGMSGRETLKQIKAKYPALRVVICSGYSLDLDSLGDDAEAAPEAVLAKPFSIDDIRRILNHSSCA